MLYVDYDIAIVSFKALYYGSPAIPEKPKPESSAMNASIIAYTKVLAMQEHFGKAWKATGSICQPGSIWVDRHMCQTVVKLTAPDIAGLSFLTIRVLPCLKTAATVSGCEVDINQGEYTIPNLISNIELGYLLQLNAYYCGVLATPRKSPKMMPPVDVAEVSRVVPTIRPIFFIGSDVEPGTPEFKAASKTRVAHHYALAMAKALAMTAIDILHTPSTLAKVKDELKVTLAAESKIHFPPFPVTKTEVNVPIIKTEMPSDLGPVGWAKRGY
ncbi:peptidase M20 domain-containing protein 2 [Elysia marginata]|uniref:Peptidase M20 domain-containing protein 2 n=1 Tax=Elysia marginata TaxID=1093978 RepID=A0AAV4JQR4_9GAST|nr:peptidase M20 domain-containing protein 2 [Elysia marginata]